MESNEVERILRELTLEQREWLMQRLNVEGEQEARNEVRAGATSTVDGAWPLSAAQQRMWLIDQLSPGDPAYNIAGAFSIRGRLNILSLKESINEIVRRHGILRTVFAVKNGQPVQTVLTNITLPIGVVDLRNLTVGKVEAIVQQLLLLHARRRYDLSEGPLLRATLLGLDEEHHVLLLAKHHIVSDGWSLGIFVRELAALYEAFSGGWPSPLPELAIQYTDFSAWQSEWLQSQTLKKQLEYWKQQLGGSLPALDLPTDFQRPINQTYEGAVQTMRLTGALPEALRTFSRQADVTLYMALLATFKALLHRYTGENDILVGTSIANRNRTEIESLIGYFVNTLVLRTGFSGGLSFQKLLSRVRKVALEAYANQDLPFEKLLEELQPERALSHTPLFQVFFNMLDYSEVAIDLPGLDIEVLSDIAIGSKFDLTLYVKEDDGDIQFELVYNVNLFSAARAAEILQQLKHLLSQVVIRPEQDITNFSLDTDLGQAVRPNPTEPLDTTWIGAVHTLFTQQADRSPTSPAVKGAGEIWTYESLNHQSNRLAHYLIANGVQAQAVVAIYGYRNVDLVWSVLGVLKAGAAFLILDPAYPVARLIDYLRVAQPHAFLEIEASGALPRALEEFVNSSGGCCCLRLPHRATPAAHNALLVYPVTNPEITVSLDDIACVGFTSGSTGKPKGVLERHGPLTHFLPWQVERFGLNKADRYSMLSGLSIDLLQREMFTPLCLGATICIPQEGDLENPGRLASWMNREEITIAYLTPAMEQVLTRAFAEGTNTGGPVNNLRYIFIGGDILTMRDVERLREIAPFATCVNSYGATETQRAVAICVVANDERQRNGKRKMNRLGKEVLPVGRGIKDAQLLILNSSGQLAGIGEIGEIHFRTPHLSKGYMGDEPLTRERFIVNPFTGANDDRLYKTGDLGRYLLDGSVELLGRTDQQVKIRGFRIELGEIEATLKGHYSVREAVVTVKEDLSGNKRLAAYVVPRNGHVAAKSELRCFIRERLPDYMVPSAFIVLETLPVAPSGKVDRRSLPDPDWAAPEVETVFIDPRNEVEESLADIWAQVLSIDRVGVHDNFFELGGHSLIAIKLISRVSETFGIKLPLRMLFERPTVDELAQAVTEYLRTSPPHKHTALALPLIEPDPRNRREPFPLTDLQQAYWIGRNAAFELGNVAAHTYLEIERNGLDLERFNLAWRKLIERHDMLRTVVLPNGRQQILERVPNYRIETFDLRGWEPLKREYELQAIRHKMSHQVLPADRWPLFEFCASRLGDESTRLHISFDLLIGDAWSYRLLIRELLDLYENPELQLAELELSFRDYVLYDRSLKDSDRYRSSRDYWLGLLPQLPPAPELPLSRDPSSVTQPRFVRRSATLEKEKWVNLKERAAREGVTGSVILLTAFAEVLATWSKDPRFTINLTLFNRPPLHPQINEIVGDFTSVTLLAVDLSHLEPFTTRAKQIQKQLWENLDHRHFSGIEVLRELARMQERASKTIMPIVFTSTLDLAMNDRNGALPSELGEVVYSVSQTPQVWLDHQVFEQLGALIYNWDTVDDLFPPGLVTDMFDAYSRLLERLAVDQWAWGGTSLQLTPIDQLEFLEQINSATDNVSEELLHTLFVSQAVRQPMDAAVIAPQLTLSYDELDSRSQVLCAELKRLGASPNRPVAVVMEKGWEQVVAVLAILRAGAPYLPLDPQLPKERLWRLLTHGQVNLILTQPRLDEKLTWPSDVRRLCIKSERVSNLCEGNPEKAVAPSDLAYLIYTSGSTGQPKGVMVEHQAAVNTIVDINKRLGVKRGDRVLAVSSLSFDLSVYDIFGALAAGGTIVIPEASVARDPARLAALMIRERVTVWSSAPAMMQMLVDYLSDRGRTLLPALRLVLLSGDWIPVSLPKRIKNLAPNAHVVSLGGATEASIWSIYYRIGEVDPTWNSIPYGLPLTNQRVYVLNESLRQCPVWVPGRLYIGGLGLARGYWQDDEKTRASFITHPQTGERLYRTGDLGRYYPDGNVEFLGREDFQVKVNGYRIELSEIETALSEHHAVKESVVVAQESTKGDKRLVAYVVSGLKSALSSADLRNFLAQKLPAYMIPAAFVILDSLPLTTNGKIDRNALIDSQINTRPAAPQGQQRTPELDERISRLVAAVLDVDELDTDANLLDIGANSVDIIRIANALDHELGYRPSVEDFFRSPTVRGIARACEDIRAKNRGKPATATSGARRIDNAGGATNGLLVDPEERERFKKQHPGLRGEDMGCRLFQLPASDTDEILRMKYASRRCYRQFSQVPITLEDFGRFLGCLRQIELNGEPKYPYASAGGLYPVQTYLYVKAGRVEGLEAGVYYYHPVEHRLTLLAPGVTLDVDAYGPFINRPIFNEAAFSLYLIARLAAVAPIYGEHSLQFATLEAGYMSQQLMMAAAENQIGLCPIGTLDFDSIRHLFALEENHIIVHSLLGGRISLEQIGKWTPFQEPNEGGAGFSQEREEGVF